MSLWRETTQNRILPLAWNCFDGYKRKKGDEGGKASCVPLSQEIFTFVTCQVWVCSVCCSYLPKQVYPEMFLPLFPRYRHPRVAWSGGSWKEAEVAILKLIKCLCLSVVWGEEENSSRLDRCGLEIHYQRASKIHSQYIHSTRAVKSGLENVGHFISIEWKASPMNGRIRNR